MVSNRKPLERKVSMLKEITELKRLICGRDSLELQQLKSVKTWLQIRLGLYLY